ncbi:MAG: DUF1737 domain-containing protein [Epsilonproteobacteria bacterium]|nr:DUF1737 domain-containing protein [Campylobacterota bacterium]
MQYKLITGPDDSTFCARITEFLKEGWKLHGSPSVAFNGESVIAAQAIVKEDDKDVKACGFTH